MNEEEKRQIAAAYQALADEAQKQKELFDQSPLPKIHIGMASCGIASGALETQASFETALADRGVEAHVHTVGCIGHCYAEPVVVIDYPDSGFPPILYPEVTPGKAKMLVKLFLEEGDPRFEHIMGATVENEMIPSVTEFSRFNREERVIMARCGKIDPEKITNILLKVDMPLWQRPCAAHRTHLSVRSNPPACGDAAVQGFPRGKSGGSRKTLPAVRS
jgi:NADH-quinone oxidoreductase subunit F